MLALHNYESAGRPAPLPSTGNTDASSGQHFPPGCTGPGSTPDERLSWIVPLLPYLEKEDLYRQFDPEKGYVGNHQAAQTPIKVYQCPAAGAVGPDATVTHYIAMAGVGPDAAQRPAGAPGNGFMGYDRLTSSESIQDGFSQTIAIMETRSTLGPWARGGVSTLRGFDPTALPLHGDNRPFGGHPEVIFAAMADGSVRVVSSSIDPQKLAAAITIARAAAVNRQL